MEFIIKNLPAKALLSLLPWMMIKVGNAWKNKDDNSVGTDDVVGEILINSAPALEALDSNNESAFNKGLKVLHTTIGNYLQSKGVKI